MFVTLEGGEGSGKTTQGKAVASALKEQGLEVVSTREPGGVPLAESIRSLVLEGEGMDPWTELFLYAAARAEHRKRVLEPALHRGAVVLCDRYSDATVAYQGYGRGLPVPAIKEICRWAEQGIRPDLTVLLDIPIATGLARTNRRGDVTRFERAPRSFHQKVRRGYLTLSREEPDRFLVLDARRTARFLTGRIVETILEHRGTES